MKALRTLILACLLAGGAVHAQTGSISGTAEGEGGAALVFASAEAYDAAGVLQGSASVEFDGSFQISGLASGTYFVRTFTIFGSYLDQWYDDVVAAGVDAIADGANPIIVTGGADTGGIVFVLSEGGAIEGTLSEVGGTAIEFEGVDVYDDTGGLAASVISEAGGVYRADGLPPGQYYLRSATFFGMHEQEWYLDQPVVSGDPLLDGATAVSVVSGSTTTHITLTLEAGGAVAGQVRSGAAPVAGAPIEVVSTGGVLVASTQTDTGGIYRVEGLAGGDYYVRTRLSEQNFVDEWHAGVVAIADPVADGATRVAIVGGSQTNGLDFDLSVGGVVAGAVSDAFGPRPAEPIELYTLAGTLMDTVLTDSNGIYQVQGLSAGSYYVRTRVFSTTDVDEWYDDRPVAGEDPVADGADLVLVVVGVVSPGIDFVLSAIEVDIVDMAFSAGWVEVSWDAMAGRIYQVSRNEGLTGAAWADAPNGSLPDEQSLQTATTAGLLLYVDTEPVATASYRVELLP